MGPWGKRGKNQNRVITMTTTKTKGTPSENTEKQTNNK